MRSTLRLIPAEKARTAVAHRRSVHTCTHVTDSCPRLDHLIGKLINYRLTEPRAIGSSPTEGLDDATQLPISVTEDRAVSAQYRARGGRHSGVRCCRVCVRRHGHRRRSTARSRPLPGQPACSGDRPVRLVQGRLSRWSAPSGRLRHQFQRLLQHHGRQAGQPVQREAERQRRRLHRAPGSHRRHPHHLFDRRLVQQTQPDHPAERHPERLPATRRGRRLLGHPRCRQWRRRHPLRVQARRQHQVRRPHRGRSGLGRGRHDLRVGQGRLDLAGPGAVPCPVTRRRPLLRLGVPGRAREPQGPLRGHGQRALEGRRRTQGQARRHGLRRPHRRQGRLPRLQRLTHQPQGRRARERPGRQLPEVLRPAESTPHGVPAAQHAHASADLPHRFGGLQQPHGDPRQAAGVRRPRQLDLRRLPCHRRSHLRLEGVPAGRPGGGRRLRELLPHTGHPGPRQERRRAQLRKHGSCRRDARHRLQVGGRLLGAGYPDRDDRVAPHRDGRGQEPSDRRQLPRRVLEQGQGRQRLLPRLTCVGLAVRRKRLTQSEALHLPVVRLGQRRDRQRLRLGPQPARRLGASQPVRAQHIERPLQPQFRKLFRQLR